MPSGRGGPGSHPDLGAGDVLSAYRILRGLPRLARVYLERFAQPGDLTGPEQLSTAVQLAAAFTHAMEPDPLLPPALLPQPWPGAHARQLTAACWTALAGARTTPVPRLFTQYEALLTSLPERLT